MAELEVAIEKVKIVGKGSVLRFNIEKIVVVFKKSCEGDINVDGMEKSRIEGVA